LVGVIAVIVVASVPLRTRRDLAQEIDYSRVSYGFYNAGETGDHKVYNWSGPDIRFYLRSSVRSIEIPMAAPFHPGTQRVEGQMRVIECEAGQVVLANGDWRSVKLRTWVVPGSSERCWRGGLFVNPVCPAANATEDLRRVAIGGIVKNLQ